ncbi:MAG: hypothetical protein ABFS45_15690 [Pseudomonadota bacterium]
MSHSPIIAEKAGFDGFRPADGVGAVRFFRIEPAYEGGMLEEGGVLAVFRHKGPAAVRGEPPESGRCGILREIHRVNGDQERNEVMDSGYCWVHLSENAQTEDEYMVLKRIYPIPVN